MNLINDCYRNRLSDPFFRECAPGAERSADALGSFRGKQRPQRTASGGMGLKNEQSHAQSILVLILCGRRHVVARLPASNNSGQEFTRFKFPPRALRLATFCSFLWTFLDNPTWSLFLHPRNAGACVYITCARLSATPGLNLLHLLAFAA